VGIFHVESLLTSGGSMTIPDNNQEHLGRAQYAAVQVRTGVRLYAVGFNPTAAYDNFFERLPIDIWPSEFAFYSVPPDGPAPAVVTFFNVSTAFMAFESVNEVTVHDAAGPHRVPVISARAAVQDIDRPFPLFS
jgi:hypothetical protein